MSTYTGNTASGSSRNHYGNVYHTYHSDSQQNPSHPPTQSNKAPARLPEDPRDLSCKLYNATEQGQVPRVRNLLERGADPNLPSNERNILPLHLAADLGSKEIVQLLLAAGADVDQTETENGWSALHVAASAGHGKVVASLVEAGADVNLWAKGDQMPLTLAAARGHENVGATLLAAGALVFAHGVQHWSPYDVRQRHLVVDPGRSEAKREQDTACSSSRDGMLVSNDSGRSDET